MSNKEIQIANSRQISENRSRTNEDVLETLRLLIKNKPYYFSNTPKEIILQIANDDLKPNEIFAGIIQLIISINPRKCVVLDCLEGFIQLAHTNLSCVDVNEEQLKSFWKWLYRVYKDHHNAGVLVLNAISIFLKIAPKCGKYICEDLFSETSTIYDRLDVTGMKNQKLKYVLPIIQCADAVVCCLDANGLTDGQVKFCTKISELVVEMHMLGTITYCDKEESGMIIINTLILLQKIITLCSDCRQYQSNKILGLAKAYMFYDELNYKDFCPKLIQSPKNILYNTKNDVEALESADETKYSKGKTLKLRKPRKTNTKKGIQGNQENFNCTIDIGFSDLDVSDTEISGFIPSDKREYFDKVRLTAIELLGTICQEKTLLYSYWHIIFPYDISSKLRDDLLYVSQKDRSQKCRRASLHIATNLLCDSKGFLSQAEYLPTNFATAFQPFSQKLGFIIISVYKVLSSILQNECSIPTVVQALKCLSALVQATPFNRIDCKLVEEFVEPVKKFVYHSDITVQISALTVLEYLILTPDIPLAIAEALSYSELCDKNYDNRTKPFWLLLKLLKNLCPDNDTKITSTVRVKSFQILSAMTLHFKNLLLYNLDGILTSLQYSYRDHQSDIRLYASRFLDNCAYQMSIFLLNNGTKDSVGKCSDFWNKILPIVMEQIQNIENMSSLKVCLCDVLSNIGLVIFEQLPNVTQINLHSFLSAISTEVSEEMTVRAAAARALAVYAIYPSLRSNLVFIENTAESILPLVKDSNLIVRIKSIWALGNVTDALLIARENSLQEQISDPLLTRMIIASTTACNDNDKVRCNAVRTLGNLLRLLTETHFNNGKNRVMITNAINKLTECVRSAGNAKVKWNACYAIGNLLQNDSLFLATEKYQDLNWQSPLYSVLCHVIKHHSNYKVRINATAAILSISARSYFGNYLEIFWFTILEAIEKSHNLHNFYEYNHRDQLQEQLCLGMCHIIKLANSDDFIILKRLLSENLEIVKSIWTRVTSRMVPEKCATLFACPILLKELIKQNSGLNTEQKRAIEFIVQATSISL